MKDYDVNRRSKFRKCLDANNLYCWAMTHYLPYGGFKWLNQKEIDEFDTDVISENSWIGYILEVDLGYTDELYDLYNDYPLVPEKRKINHDMLSNYCKNIGNYYGLKIGNVNTLVPNLGNKSKYILHYRNLQLNLSWGMTFTKVHRLLEFKQLDWLKTYIDFNKGKRKYSANNFEKHFL